MQVRIANTYACRTATKSSSATSATVKANGINAPSQPKAPKPASMTTNPPNTWSEMCPASMLANSRTLWETGRDMNERISMKVTSGRIRIGMPLGTNSLRKRKPCFTKPEMTTVRKTTTANATVMMMWLVTENEYGNHPMTFRARMNMKIENTNGKNFI